MIQEELETAAQAIHYLASKLGSGISKLKMVKLAFLADKYHLLHYGRTITRDGFIAMPYGPVGSNVLNLINLNQEWLPAEAVEMAEKYLSLQGKEVIPKGEVEYDLLSESDKKALDYTIQKFGPRTAKALVDYLHKFPEWQQFEDRLDNGSRKSFEIDEKALFSVPNEDLDITAEEAKTTQDIYNGQY